MLRIGERIELDAVIPNRPINELKPKVRIIGIIAPNARASKGVTFGNFKIISSLDVKVMTKGFENGFCISRKCFDQGLLEMAIQNGAKIVTEKVLDVQRKGSIWNVITSK